ncbi:MAG: hypothetical protein KIT84_08345 [Labilithrix sp.]|nr:hypothetical protein [Labilithrix sp.]MCW5811007.1 hypothetical protein [Labilithrix sp.]
MRRCRKQGGAEELFPVVRASASIASLDLRLAPWFDSVLPNQDRGLVAFLDGIDVKPDAAWKAYLSGAATA